MATLQKYQKVVAIDIETTGLDRDAEIVCAAIAWENGSEVLTKSFWLDRFKDHSIDDDRAFEDFLNTTLFNPHYDGTILFHNLDFDIKFLLHRYFKKKRFSSKDISQVFDTLTISRILRNNKYVAHTDPRRLKCHSLKFLALEYLGVSHTTFGDVVSDGNIRFAAQSNVMDYNQKDAILTLKLFRKFMTVAAPEEWSYIEAIEMPHLLNIVHMNYHGVPYDAEEARKLSDRVAVYSNDLETKIFKMVGRSFNILSQPELASALFYNPQLTYRNALGEDVVIHPLYLTEKGISKVDLDTLTALRDQILKIDSHSRIIETINNITQFLELSKAISFIESHLSLAVKDGAGYVLYPNFSAEAKSGRVKSSRPNLLGVPKTIFKKSNLEYVPVDLKDKSIRHLMKVPPDYKVSSIDISALDLSVVAHGAKAFDGKFTWLDFFGNPSEPDIHFEVSRIIDKERFKKALENLDNLPPNIDDYYIKKPGKDDNGIPLVHKTTGDKWFCHYKKEVPNAASIFKTVRNAGKVANLSTSYMMGATSAAVNSRKELDEPVGIDDAQKLLEKFYEAFPAIRRFQDDVANKIYEQGYVCSPFGRRYYADCYDELNEQYRQGNNIYELICHIDGRYWYLKARGWCKFPPPVVEDLRVVAKPFGLIFEDVLAFVELDRDTFRKSTRKAPSKFKKKSEENLDEVNQFELSRISITNEVDHQLGMGNSLTSKAKETLVKFVHEGKYLIPEKYIQLYRVKTGTPSHKYFRIYKRLITSVRKFFPMYCQGVANTLASLCLTDVRKRIEDENLDARVLLFVHDQIDVMVHISQVKTLEDVLTASIEKDKSPFDVKLSGKLGELTQHIRSD